MPQGAGDSLVSPHRDGSWGGQDPQQILLFRDTKALCVLQNSPTELSPTRKGGGEGIHVPIMRNGMLKVSPTRTGLGCDGSTSLDPWKTTTPQGSCNSILDCMKGSNEFLEIRILMQAGAPLLLPSQGDTAPLLLWESPLGSLWILG